jgi:hypothetical protein
MNPKETKFYEYLLNFLTVRGIWLTKEEDEQMKTEIDKIAPNRSEIKINKAGKLSK